MAGSGMIPPFRPPDVREGEEDVVSLAHLLDLVPSDRQGRPSSFQAGRL